MKFWEAMKIRSEGREVGILGSPDGTYEHSLEWLEEQEWEYYEEPEKIMCGCCGGEGKDYDLHKSFICKSCVGTGKEEPKEELVCPICDEEVSIEEGGEWCILECDNGCVGVGSMKIVEKEILLERWRKIGGVVS